MPNWGGAASGAASGAALGSFLPGPGTAIGAGVGGLLGLFTGGKKKTAADGSSVADPADTDPLNDILGKLNESRTAASARSGDLTGMGDDALRPVLDYFKKIMGGDPNAALEATRPERTRVIDQYDTARKMISEFSPRGGGSNAALSSSRFDEASDLSNITALARRDAVGKSAELGTALTGLGLSAEQIASADLNTIVNAILRNKNIDANADLAKSGQNKALYGDLAQGLGTLLGLFLTRDKKAA